MVYVACSEARPTTATYTDSTHQQDRFQGGTAERDHGLLKTDQNRGQLFIIKLLNQLTFINELYNAFII